MTYFGENINQIPVSIDTSGNIYNGKGYKENTYINNKQEMYVDNISTTGFIPFTIGDTVYFKNLTFAKNANHRISFYDVNKTYLGYTGGHVVYCTMTVWVSTFDENDCYTSMTPTTYVGEGTAEGTAYIRISAADIDKNSIITVNREAPDTTADCELANKVKSLYFGDESNIARKIVTAYFGDENGIARLFWS